MYFYLYLVINYESFWWIMDISVISLAHIQYCSFETCGEFTGNIHMNSPQENSPWGIPLGESDSLPQANWWIHEECPGNQIHGEFPMVNSPWWILHWDSLGIPDGEFPIGNSPWWIPHGELFLGNRMHSREFIWFILENLGMQQQNAAIYVCKEANCQLKKDTEGHRGLCKFPTANSPNSSPRIRRLPHREFADFPTTNSLPRIRRPISIAGEYRSVNSRRIHGECSPNHLCYRRISFIANSAN